MKIALLMTLSFLVTTPFLLIYHIFGNGNYKDYEDAAYIAFFNTLICICAGVFILSYPYVPAKYMLVMMEWLSVGSMFVMSMLLKMLLKTNKIVYKRDPNGKECMVMQGFSLMSLVVLLIVTMWHTYLTGGEITAIILGQSS
jgi:hypothetical protein